MLKILGSPELKSPILMCGFTGWADAASAASGALRYLLLKREGITVARFDPESIYVYTTSRPLTLKDPIYQRRIEWPSLELTAIQVPEAEHDLLILLGTEPDLRWQECVREIYDLATKSGVSTVITFGAFLAQVHFAGPPALMGISADASLRSSMSELGLEDSDYQGPTGFTTVLLREAIDRGIPSASLWAAAPSYLSSTSNPKLSSALLGAAERLIGQDLWKGELEAAGRHMERRLQDAIRTRPDLAELLKRLQGEGDDEQTIDLGDLSDAVEASDEQDEQDDQDELPTSEEVLRDLEAHLRRLRGDSEPRDEDDPGSD